MTTEKIKILETGKIFNIKTQNNVFTVFWLNEPFTTTNFGTLVDVGIISNEKIEKL